MKKVKRKPRSATKTKVVRQVRKISSNRTRKNKAKVFVLPRWIFWVIGTIGLSMVLVGGIYLLYRQTILSFRVSPTVVVQSQFRPSEPVHIQVSAVGIQIDVVPAQIVNGIWETSDVAASHLVTSARPGEAGNIVVYGHNVPTILGRLHDVRQNDVVEVTNGQGLRRKYLIANIQRVKPSEVSVVLPTEDEVLTLYTCTGFLDSMRLVIQAKPLE